MRRFVYAMILLVFSSGAPQVHAQNSISPTPKYAWLLQGSLNHMVHPVDNIVPKPGFGFAFLRLWRKEKQVQTLLGFAFQKNGFFVPSSRPGHYSSYKNMSLSMTAFSVPYRVRLSLGERTRFFAEAGISLDFNILKGNGVQVAYPPYQPEAVEQAVRFNFGTYPVLMGGFGSGVMFPLKNSLASLSVSFQDDLLHIAGLNSVDFTTYRSYISLNFGLVLDLDPLPKK